MFWIALGTILFCIACWIAYEAYNAPMGDENGIIRRSDINSARKPQPDNSGAHEGALIAELSDIEFSSPARRISG